MATYSRIQKNTARKLFNSGYAILAIPHRMNPANRFFAMGAVLERATMDSFDHACNAMTYYNCTNETGYYLAFYIVRD